MEFWDPQPPTILWLGLVHGDPQAALQLQVRLVSLIAVSQNVEIAFVKISPITGISIIFAYLNNSYTMKTA